MTERISGPTLEPLTLGEAKAFLRIDTDGEDPLISALIAAARRVVEASTGRALLTQSWRLVRDAWPPSGVFALPVAPVRALLAARVRNADGGTQDIDLALLRLVTARTPALVHLDPAQMPQPGMRWAGIEIELEAGYGDAAADVPADLVQAVRLVLAHFHEHRDAPGDTLRLPATVAELLMPYKLVRL
ncbi:MAG: hypothetical protein B7Y75_06045 [Azorhizobium sp. 35-67-5]|nr:MAG: hypothetical protein B7Y75_06045 [Azorhizobium sp. 35-67-5]